MLFRSQKLAAARAREAKLRDFIFDYIDIEPNNERMIQRYDECVKPPDDTALRQYVVRELRQIEQSINSLTKINRETSYEEGWNDGVDYAEQIACRRADELENGK